MTHPIITAEEARTLREAATPGPWRDRDDTVEADAAPLDGVEDDGSGWTVCEYITHTPDAALIAAAPDLAATVEALHAEVERLWDIERWAGELLARIHRDGGHHTNNVGWEQAFLDADDWVVKWLGRCADAALERAP